MMLEHVGNQLDGHLRGDLAMKVPTHTIRHQQQQRLLAIGISDPILVVFAPALTAGLVNGKFQPAKLI
jgi:hypothetical protein